MPPYEGDPASSTSDELRFLIGDTSSTALLSDDEVDYLLASYDTTVQAAYQGALSLAAKFSAKADISVGSASLSYQAQAERMMKVAESLEARGGAAGSVPSATERLRVGPPTAGGLVTDESPLTMYRDWRYQTAETTEPAP